MRRFSRLALAGLILAASVATAPAATLRYDAIHVLGDSLSDVGNIHRLTAGVVPESPPYDRLRFSNGRIRYDRVAAAFRADGGSARNFAYGGARAAENRDAIPDLGAQRRMLLDRVDPGRGDLAAIWIGGNDLLNDPGDVGVARAAADAAYSTARRLHGAGYGAAMLFNLPNFADIPRFLGSDPARRRAVRRASVAYNDRLANRATALRARGMAVIEVDVFGLFADVTADPSAYGLRNMTRPCIRGGRDRCSAAEARVAGFADNVHPSSALHAVLARHVLGLLDTPTATAVASGAGPAPVIVGAVRAPVAAVPLPSSGLLVVTALAGLLVAGRRRAAGVSVKIRLRSRSGTPIPSPDAAGACRGW